MIRIQSHKVAYYSNYERMKTLVIHIQGTKFLASHSMMSKVFFLSQQPATFQIKYFQVKYAPLVLKWALHTQIVSAKAIHLLLHLKKETQDVIQQVAQGNGKVVKITQIKSHIFNFNVLYSCS